MTKGTSLPGLFRVLGDGGQTARTVEEWVLRVGSRDRDYLWINTQTLLKTLCTQTVPAKLTTLDSLQRKGRTRIQ